VNPSGTQYEIAFGTLHACVVEVGGGLRTFTAGDTDVLLGYPADEPCTAARGQVLAPWPNRIADGRYVFEGSELQLPLTEPDRSTAIHGLVRFASWTPVAHHPSAVELVHLVHPQPGYPFTLRLEVQYHLDADGLHVRTTAENLGDEACPFGLGFHPYLAGHVDELVLSVPARTSIISDDQGVELRREPARLTESHTIGQTVLDETLTDLVRDADGRARIRVGSLELWCDTAFPFLQVFSGDLPDVRRGGLAVEPMTCAPNAFRSGDGLLRLEPGERFAGTWGIFVTQTV
jgi:aldose 1-epimerase